MAMKNEFPIEIDVFQKAVGYCMVAHSQHVNTADDAIRFSDKVTPYSVHPIWCAMTLLTETELSESIRYPGYLALLWHDVLEDTSAGLPEYATAYVKELVSEMTFSSMSEEKKLIWSKPEVVRLLKLYDKVSNLLDGSWMSDKKWNSYVSYSLELTADVSKSFHDRLNIVKIARQIAVVR